LTIATDRALAAARGLTRLDLDLLAYVPSNTIASIINAFGEPKVLPNPIAFPVARDDEAVGTIGAASLAARSGAILMQDNGLGNSLTALGTFAVAYQRTDCAIAVDSPRRAGGSFPVVAASH